MDQSARPPRLSPETRAAIQASTESVRVLARRHGVNPKTIQRWRHRDVTADRAPGPGAPATALSAEEVATIVSFRQATGLPLDDCLYALQPLIPHLRRATLHRCLRRHAISRLAGAPSRAAGGESIAGLGRFHITMLPAPTQSGMAYLFAATNLRTRFAFASLLENSRGSDAAAFLAALASAMPFDIDTVSTDNGTCFTDGAFSHACRTRAIRHVICETARTFDGADPRHFKYRTPAELGARLAQFMSVVNFQLRLKALGGMTPYDAMCGLWRVAPERFRRDPQGKEGVLF